MLDIPLRKKILISLIVFPIFNIALGSDILASTPTVFQKPIMLAFRPDQTEIRHIFTHAITPIYMNSDFNAIKSMLQNELSRYVNIAAINDDDQSNRIFLVQKAESLGFDMIELDEQLLRDTLTPADLNNLKLYTKLPIGITATPAPIITFLNKGGKPDVIFMEVYTANYRFYIDEIKSKTTAPVYGVVNFADPTKETSNPNVLRETAIYLWIHGDGILFWGWKTGSPAFEPTAISNWPTVKNLVKDFNLHCEKPEKRIMLITHADQFNTYKQKFEKIANLPNVEKYNYMGQPFTKWGLYCDLTMPDEDLKNIVNFWNGLGFTTGFYIDVGECDKTIAQTDFSDSILELNWADWGSRMTMDPTKSWYKHLKNCALDLIRRFNITALNIDRSDVVGVGGSQEDQWLQQWLDEVKTEASNKYGINLKFVGNSFQDWQTSTVSRFWFIGTDGVPAKNNEIFQLQDGIQKYKNLAQYTEKGIFYIAPWLQDPEILNNDDLLVEEYENILRYHDFTAFDDWTIFRLMENTKYYFQYPKFLCLLNVDSTIIVDSQCRGIIPEDSWGYSGQKETCSSSCSYISESDTILDGGWPDFFQPECLNQNPAYNNANQIRDFYCSDSDRVCKITYDSFIITVSVNGVTSGDIAVSSDKDIEVFVDIKNTGSFSQGWWFLGVEFWKVDDYTNPWNTRSQRVDTYYNGKDSTHGNIQGVSGADCFLINDPNNNKILDPGETIRLKCKIPASYYGTTSGNQRIMFWIHERDLGQDASRDGCSGDSLPNNCGTAAGQCIYDGKQGCYGGSWWTDALARIEPAGVKAIIIPPPCSGPVSLSLSPNPVWAGKTVKATVSGLSNCDGKTAYVRMGTYKILRCSCTVSGSGCSCNFTAPTPFTSPTSYSIYAQVDLNGNGSIDSGEEATQSLTVYCKAEGTYCSTNYPCCSGLYCSNNKCQSVGGGCPYLKVWNGKEFVKVEKLNIHVPKNIDTTYTTSFEMKPIEDGKYKIILSEMPYALLEGSHIDYVKLIDQSGKECQLISAIHSKDGDVLDRLIKSDDFRARTDPGEEIILVFKDCSGEIFDFTIEGYNPWPLFLKTTLIYFTQERVLKGLIVLIIIEAILIIIYLISKLLTRRSKSKR